MAPPPVAPPRFAGSVPEAYDRRVEHGITIVAGAATLGVALACASGWGCASETNAEAGSGPTTSSSGGTHAGGTSAGGGGAGATGGGGGSAGAGAVGGAGGGGGGGPSCGDADLMAAYAACVVTNTQQACEAAGGAWTIIGLSQTPLCVCPTGQDGCVCTRSTDCVAGCIAEPTGGAFECDGVTEGHCTPHAPFAGCWCIFDENGEITGYCID